MDIPAFAAYGKKKSTKMNQNKLNKKKSKFGKNIPTFDKVMTKKKVKLFTASMDEIRDTLGIKDVIPNGNIRNLIRGVVLDPVPPPIITDRITKKHVKYVSDSFNRIRTALGMPIREDKKKRNRNPVEVIENQNQEMENDTINVPKKPKSNITATVTSTSVPASTSTSAPTTASASAMTKNELLEPESNSIQDGEHLLKWLMQPIEINNFMESSWEKSPCFIQRKQSFYGNLISFEMINKMLLENHIEFTKNIDITSYKNGVRETLNPEGRAMPSIVWEKYAEGCSIRILNPQTFLTSLFSLSSILQEYFHCMVGANVYLTPPNSQGFAPHYDDIEAFVLQIEGKKKWKLYNPRNKNEKLPRISSENLNENEIGSPIFEKVLEAGDLLYFPRGTIHQASTEPGHHSLHITISVYQKQSYADLFEKMMPIMLKKLFEQDVEMRKGLPLSIWSNFGFANLGEKSIDRNNTYHKCKELLHKTMTALPFAIDYAVDELAKGFMHDALPPYLNAREKALTIFGSRTILNKKDGTVHGYEFTAESRIKLLRANILRLIKDGDSFCIYFYTDNSKEYHEHESNFMEIDVRDTRAIEMLIKSYPNYMYIKDLPGKNNDAKIGLASALFDRGMLMTNKPVFYMTKE